MKYSLTLFLLTASIISFSQNKIDYKQITNNWIYGKIDSTSQVITPFITRGGASFLFINADTTIIHKGQSNCGFGHKELGKWKINKKNSTITFKYTTSVGYRYNTTPVEINNVEIYKIEKLSSNELILSQIIDGKKIIFPFLKTELK